MIEIVTTTGPTSEPITTEQAKTHLRVTHYDDDAYIDALITAARLAIEGRTGTRLFTQTTTMYADSFDEAIQTGHRGVHRFMRDNDTISLRVAPVQSVVSVKYYDNDDADQTFASSNYWTDLNSVPCRLQVKDSANWPSTNERVGNVRIEMTAGYATVAAIPQHYQHAMKLLIGHWYENREQTTPSTLSEIPEGITNLLMAVSGEYQHYVM